MSSAYPVAKPHCVRGSEAPTNPNLPLLLVFDRNGFRRIFLILFHVRMLDDVLITVTGLGGNVEGARGITGTNAHSLGFLGRDFDRARVTNAGTVGRHGGP